MSKNMKFNNYVCWWPRWRSVIPPLLPLSLPEIDETM